MNSICRSVLHAEGEVQYGGDREGQLELGAKVYGDISKQDGITAGDTVVRSSSWHGTARVVKSYMTGRLKLLIRSVLSLELV